MDTLAKSIGYIIMISGALMLMTYVINATLKAWVKTYYNVIGVKELKRLVLEDKKRKEGS